MAVPVIKSSFSSGEVAPALWGRVDLEKYKTGCALLRNFFVDYRGGVSSRTGSLFCGPSVENALCRLVPFVFSTDQSYVVELSNERIRFVQNGAYVLGPSAPITAWTQGNITVISADGLQPSEGDQVYISGAAGLDYPNGLSAVNGRTFQIAPDFTLSDPITGEYFDSTLLTIGSGGTASLIYSIASPYLEADLFTIVYAQSNDVLDLTHANYAPMQLRRTGAADWSLVAVSTGAVIAPPANVTAIPYGEFFNGTNPVLRYNYAVTSIDSKTGEESNISQWIGCTNNDLNQNTGVCNIISWAAVVGAAAYRVYKALVVPVATATSPPYFVGYMGSTTNTTLHDINIEPDFTQVPPTHQNPFQSGPVTGFNLVSPGYGFIDPALTITDPTGTGAAGTVTVDASGAVTAVALTTPGENYSSPQVIVAENDTTPGQGLALHFDGTWVLDTTAGGSGGYIPGPDSITISSGGRHYHAPIIYLDVPLQGNLSTQGDHGILSGHTTNGVVTSLELILQRTGALTTDGNPPNGDVVINFSITDAWGESSYGAATVTADVAGTLNPAVVAYFQQRKFYAGAANAPETFNASRVGLYGNFDTSYPTQPDDAISGTIVGSEVNTISSLTPMAGGLVALTSGGAFLISGGTPQAAITPASITAAAQAFSGAAPLQPLRINYDLIYVQARGSAVRDLSYNFYVNVYTGNDISYLSSHLFYGRQLVQWAYAEEPFKLIWAVRDDGVLLSCTYMKEQEVSGWARHDTQGLFESVCVIPENGEDMAYVAVNRSFNGVFYRTIERFQSRNFGANPGQNRPSAAEQAWCVDCGVALLPTPQDVAIVSGAPVTALPGSLANATVLQGGSGYAADPGYQIIDLDPTATPSGGSVFLTVAAGEITGCAVVDPGEGFKQPAIELYGGNGAIISLGTQNLWQFATVDTSVPGGGGPSSGGGSTETLNLQVGQVVRIGGGKGIVTDVQAPNFTADMWVEPTALVFSAPTKTLLPQAIGAWTADTPKTQVSGLEHLNGCTVSINMDGNALPPQVVVGGSINLPAPATYVIAGLPFTAQVQTLRIDGGEPTIQGRRKLLPAVTLRTLDTRGISVGSSFRTLVDVKERQHERTAADTGFSLAGGWQEPPYQNGPLSPVPIDHNDTRTVLNNVWQESGYVCLQQTYPMPVTLLGEIIEMSVGDSPS